MENTRIFFLIHHKKKSFIHSFWLTILLWHCRSLDRCYGCRVDRVSMLSVCPDTKLDIRIQWYSHVPNLSTPAIQQEKRKCWCLFFSRLFSVSHLPSPLWALWDDWGWQKLLQSCPEICQSFLLLGIVILGRTGGICQIRNMSDDKTK